MVNPYFKYKNKLKIVGYHKNTFTDNVKVTSIDEKIFIER